MNPHWCGAERSALLSQVNGVVLVYQEPAEAANPRQRWRLYQFKGGKPFQARMRSHL
jgi:hypothetical protein